jgi:hypothetical protein
VGDKMIFRLKSHSIIVLIAMSMIINVCTSFSVEAKELPTSGTDCNGNQWAYDTDTRTLTFSGNQPTEDCNDLDSKKSDPLWWTWGNEAESIIIENGIPSISSFCFEGFVSTKTLKLPDSLVFIGNGAFSDIKSIEVLDLPESLKTIDSYAFCGANSLRKINLSKTEKIGNFAFCGESKLEDVILSPSIKSLGAGAFAQCKKLESIRLSNGITRLQGLTFRGCSSLKSIQLPQSLISIEDAAFSNSAICKVTIPANVDRLINTYDKTDAEGIFENCKHLETVTFQTKKLQKVYKGAFHGIPQNAVIRIPRCRYKKYKKMFRKSGLSKKIRIKAY